MFRIHSHYKENSNGISLINVTFMIIYGKLLMCGRETSDKVWQDFLSSPYEILSKSISRVVNVVRLYLIVVIQQAGDVTDVI